MSGGIGRGRGWLNLKMQGARSPGLENNHSPPLTNNVSPNFSNQDNRTFSDASSDFNQLICKIKQLNLDDDGIKFNQKIRYIVEGWNAECQNGVEVEKSFDAIHQACLVDSDLATKLVHLIASRTFLSQEVHEQNIRLMFLRKLQDNFEAGSQMQSSNPAVFRNSIQLMGEFFNKARLANGQHFSFMATPLLSYLDMLLESTEIPDLKLFSTQFHLNGNALRQECPEKVAEIISKLRLKICSDKKYTKDSKLWLLLSLEIANNRFAILPSETQSFYHEQLGDDAAVVFPGSFGTLIVQTVHNNKKLDSYQSSVNVLQVSTEAPSEGPLHDSGLDVGSSTNCNSSGCQSDLSQNYVSARKDSIGSQKGGSAKSGRPILGIGARLQRTRTTEDSWEDKPDPALAAWNRNRNQNNTTNTGDWQKSKSPKETKSDANWRDRDSNKGGSEGGQKKDWDKKKVLPKSKKGWEHDDRFETDYS